MKKPSPKHEKEGINSVFYVLVLIIILMSSMTLGSLRLYGLYLEHRLADVTTKTQLLMNKNTELEEKHSSMLSPARVYTYASSKLNMATADEVTVVKLNGDNASQNARLAKAAGAPVRERGMPVFFMKKANAQD